MAVTIHYHHQHGRISSVSSLSMTDQPELICNGFHQHLLVEEQINSAKTTTYICFVITVLLRDLNNMSLIMSAMTLPLKTTMRYHGQWITEMTNTRSVVLLLISPFLTMKMMSMLLIQPNVALIS